MKMTHSQFSDIYIVSQDEPQLSVFFTDNILGETSGRQFVEVTYLPPDAAKFSESS